MVKGLGTALFLTVIWMVIVRAWLPLPGQGARQGGAWTSICVSDWTVHDVTVLPPNVTPTEPVPGQPTPWKPVPISVTSVPPHAGPELGLIAVMVGAPRYEKWV